MDAARTIPTGPSGPAPRSRSTLNGLTVHGRLLSGCVAACCLAVLSGAGWLEPSAAGHGTHEQIGLPPCVWPLVFKIPCPTCGMTTAFAHAADGDLASAFQAQPFGLLLALGIAATFWVGVYGCATGSRAAEVYGTMLRPKVLWGLTALAAAAWVYKIATWQGA